MALYNTIVMRRAFENGELTYVNQLEQMRNEYIELKELEDGIREKERIEKSRERMKSVGKHQYILETKSSLRSAHTESTRYPESEQYERFWEFLGNHDDRIAMTREEYYTSHTIKGLASVREYLYKFIKLENK